MPKGGDPHESLSPSGRSAARVRLWRPHRRRSRRPGRIRRFVRGYLMLVGALTTLYVLVQLLVRLFIEIGKWMPPA